MRLLRSLWVRYIDAGCGIRFSMHGNPRYVCQRNPNHHGDHHDYAWADAQPHAS